MDDYAKLGFKCGIEIHQQLETGKLFCGCPSIVHDTNPDLKVIRRLRPVVGETGEVDIAALHEMKKGKYFIYEACSTSSCLVEMDEEPPHPINSEALQIALQIALLLNARIVDEVQVMRKTVIDGSNTSGFQRTALIAMNGHVETSKGMVRIPTICLEEEAAKRIKEDGKSVTFRLDRLGVPLIEVGTDIDIKDPEHAKETAEKIGMILRSTGKVKRGIGTIRQDVNVNIRGYPRVEIKGFQELRSMPKIIEYEIKRQLKELKAEKKADAHVRKAEPDGTTSFLRPMPGSARMYPETDVMPVRPVLKKTEKVELIDDKVKALEKIGVGKDLAAKAVREGKEGFITQLAKELKEVKAAFIAETVIGAKKTIKTQFGIDVSPSDDDFRAIFAALEKGEISKSSVLDILKEGKPASGVIGKFAMMPDSEIEAAIREIAEKNKGAPINALMGMAMGKLKGKADGKKVMDILRKIAK